MVTQMLQSMTMDVLRVVKDTDYFSLEQAKRDAVLTKELHDYPKSVISYLSRVDEESFVGDMEEMLPVLGSTSVIAEAKQLVKNDNGYFSSVLKALSDCRRMAGDTTDLAKRVRWFGEASGMYKRVFDRELQLLLRLATGEDSPIAQIAVEEEVDVGALPGVPSVQVQRSLLGGSRVFHNGTLNDRSWRARLTKILSAVS